MSWIEVTLLLPDDGTGALPLPHHLIPNDQEGLTYKLGLLRALCRTVASCNSLARENGDGHVLVPLGVVALHWPSLYLALVRAGRPRPSTAPSGTQLTRSPGCPLPI